MNSFFSNFKFPFKLAFSNFTNILHHFSNLKVFWSRRNRFDSCVFCRIYSQPLRGQHKIQQFDQIRTHLGAIFNQSWAHLGPIWADLLATLGLDDHFVPDLGRSRALCRAVWTSFWTDLTAISPVWSNFLRSQKTLKKCAF